MSTASVSEEQLQAVMRSIRTFYDPTRKEIQASTGMSDRKCRAAIRELRRLGEPIVCCGDSGYRLASDPEDVRGLIRYYESYIADMAETVRALKETAARMDGMPLFTDPTAEAPASPEPR